jgi:hypothetical protein
MKQRLVGRVFAKRMDSARLDAIECLEQLERERAAILQEFPELGSMAEPLSRERRWPGRTHDVGDRLSATVARMPKTN